MILFLGVVLYFLARLFVGFVFVMGAVWMLGYLIRIITKLF